MFHVKKCILTHMTISSHDPEEKNTQNHNRMQVTL
jgi:hypothetical protein